MGTIEHWDHQSPLVPRMVSWLWGSCCFWLFISGGKEHLAALGS